MENNQNQGTNDFFAAMQNENTEKTTENKFSKASLLPGETVSATAKWLIAPIIILAIIVALIFWILFFDNVNKTPYYLYGEIAWGLYFPIALVFTLIAILVAWSMKFQEFVITNKRVIAYYGFIRRIAFELKTEQVESIIIYQSIIGRLFGFGTVQVFGIGASKARVHFVENPFEFRQHFFDMQYKENNNTLD